jgi:L,D-transpeptidase catalytic domain
MKREEGAEVHPIARWYSHDESRRRVPRNCYVSIIAQGLHERPNPCGCCPQHIEMSWQTVLTGARSSGGDGNPLGARAPYLGDTLFRIHGTNQPSTIGTFVSSGCIRLTNEDITDLCKRVRVGTRVVVLSARSEGLHLRDHPSAPSAASATTMVDMARV